MYKCGSNLERVTACGRGLAVGAPGCVVSGLTLDSLVAGDRMTQGQGVRKMGVQSCVVSYL